MNYVIIGNSAAAIGCIEGIRTVDKESPITVISNEPHHTYSRPLISYLLLGKTDEQKMKYRDDDFYKKNNCKTIFGTSVTSIDKDNKQVILEDNTKIGYDKLLVATGSNPFVPSIEGIEKVKNKFTFMTLDDAKALQSCINKESNVLIVGGGLIGLKCAEGINKSVKSITIVDLAPSILPSILDEHGSAMVQKHIEENDVKFILSDSISTVTENTATLKSGIKIDFDIIVIAVGVRPNIKLVQEIGGEVGRGIVTDEQQKTSISDIYSAGDCCESNDISCDQRRVLALLPNAYIGGECAGINMAGGSATFDNAIPMNAIGFFGLHIITAGSYQGESYIVQDEKNYKRLFTADGLLKGYIMIGDIERAGIYTSLIKNKTPLDTIDFDLIKDKPQLMAFSAKQRGEKLGGQNNDY